MSTEEWLWVLGAAIGLLAGGGGGVEWVRSRQLRQLDARVQRLDGRVRVVEEQIGAILVGTRQILEQQQPMAALAAQLTGALVEVTQKPARGGRRAASTQIKIATVTSGDNLTIGGTADRRQSGGTQVQGDAAVRGPVVGGNLGGGSAPAHPGDRRDAPTPEN